MERRQSAHEEESIPGDWIGSPFDLGLPTSRTVRNKFSLLQVPVYGILLRHPEMTNTYMFMMTTVMKVMMRNAECLPHLPVRPKLI